MFKRKHSHAQEGSTNDDHGAEKGKPGSAADEEQQPKKRALPQRSVTFDFFQRTWEEIPPGRMFYLPTCQNPAYMFDQMMTNQYNKYKNLWSTMTITKPKVRISNIIMLQDDLRVQNNTPTDATAFTQVCYLMHWVPQNQQQFFRLVNIKNFETMTGDVLTYELNPNIANTQLVELKNFELFETLGLQTASTNDAAGFTFETPTFTDGRINGAYISPRATVPLNYYSHSMNPIDVDGTMYVPSLGQIYMARNMNGLSFHKYGDEIEFELETNLDGVHLMNDNFNNFKIEGTITNGNYTYLTDWVYPGKNRPFRTRSANMDFGTDPVTAHRHMKPIQHHFFMMPPILKPNGSLLGQRCSFVLEQSFSVTFHFSQAFFDVEDVHINVENMIHQNNGVILRRGIYPYPAKSPTIQYNYFCGRNSIVDCTGNTCPLGGTLEDWVDWMVTTIPIADFEDVYTMSTIKPAGVDIFDESYLTKERIDIRKDIWMDMLEQRKDICFRCSEGKIVTVGGVQYWALGDLTDTAGASRYFKVHYGGESTKSVIYLTFIGQNIYDMYRDNGIKCYLSAPTKPLQPITKQQAIAYDRTCSAFYV